MKILRKDRPLAGWSAVSLLVLLAFVLDGSSAAMAEAGSTGPAVRALSTRLDQPEDVAFDPAGNLYVSEFEGNRVDRIGPAGSLTVVAGTGVAGYSGTGGLATAAQLNAPTGLTFDANGHLVIADHHNDCIRGIGSSGTILTIAGTCARRGAQGDGGPATAAKLNDPIGITYDRAGNLFIADEQNALVRRVGVDGTITTVAGGGTIPVADAPDGTAATRVRLGHPSYVVVDRGGAVYFSDFCTNVVMKVDTSGRIWHVAGVGTKDDPWCRNGGFSGDGGPATQAELHFPTGLAFDGQGRLFITDAMNNRIRMVETNGVITTVAGTGDAGYSGDGGLATAAALNAPAGLELDRHGDLFVADQCNGVIRMVNRAGVISLVAGTPTSECP